MSRTHVADPRIPSIGIGTCFAAAAAALAIALGAASAATPARSQERTSMTADTEAPALARDRAAVAALGLDLATIEQAEDVPLLWRAVRELVLPGKVSEATQQRILRRVWLIDPDIRRSSYLDSPNH